MPLSITVFSNPDLLAVMIICWTIGSVLVLAGYGLTLAVKEAKGPGVSILLIFSFLLLPLAALAFCIYALVKIGSKDTPKYREAARLARAA